MNTDLERLLELVEVFNLPDELEIEFKQLKSKLNEKLEKTLMWERSYHESERCLIERGKEIQSLKSQLEQVRTDTQITILELEYKNEELSKKD